MRPFNIDDIRADFPILGTLVHKHPLIYLDNAATTQKPQVVLQAIQEGYSKYNANVHRGVHYLSAKATEMHETSRRRVAQFINAPNARQIIFTKGTTEAINLVAHSYGEAYISAGDEIIISTMEHHANIVPWQMLCQRKGAQLRVIQLTAEGELDMAHYASLLSERTKLVAISHASNVLGTINPVEEVIRLAHARGAHVLVDGAQAIAHLPVDVQSLGADFYVFSAHKVYGPTGVGVLYGREELLEAMPPYMGGGAMIKSVSFERTTYNELPFKFEAGTPDYVGIVGLSHALDYVSALGLKTIAQHEDDLLRYTTEGLRTIAPNVRILGEAEHKSAIISFAIGDIHPFDLGTLLDRLGVAIRTGHHCAEPLLSHYGYSAIARASFAVYNTKAEADRFLEAVDKVRKML